jgi:integrase
MDTAAAPPPTLLAVLRREIRARHMSLRTEDTYVYWVRDFVRCHGRRHPRELGAAEVEAYLTMLANHRRVAASTHNRALSALLFLYRAVLKAELPWLDNLQRPRRPLRLRVKDVDFDRLTLLAREGKGGKDRALMLPQSLVADLRAQLSYVHLLWQRDRAQEVAGVELP